MPQVVLISALLGSLVGVGLILFGGRHKDLPIPFGPYLALAGWIALLWGPQINAWYLGWSGLGYGCSPSRSPVASAAARAPWRATSGSWGPG